MSPSTISAAFADHGAILVVHTCAGEGVSPPGSFSGVPETAASLALITADEQRK